LNYGNCEFFTDEDYVDLVNMAMDQLDRSDVELYKEITGKKITFNLSKGILEFYHCSPNGRYYIPNWMVGQGVSGLKFGVVVHYFQYVSMHNYGCLKLKLFYSDEWILNGFDLAVVWLRNHDYSEESITYLESFWYDMKGISREDG
jgi:hypothetical protein